MSDDPDARTNKKEKKKQTYSRVHEPCVDDVKVFARVRQVPLVEIAKFETLKNQIH